MNKSDHRRKFLCGWKDLFIIGSLIWLLILKNVLAWNLKKIMLRFVYKCRLAVGKDKLSQKALFSVDYFRDSSETLETCAKVNWHFCRVYIVTPTFL